MHCYTPHHFIHSCIHAMPLALTPPLEWTHFSSIQTILGSRDTSKRGHAYLNTPRVLVLSKKKIFHFQSYLSNCIFKSNLPPFSIFGNFQEIFKIFQRTQIFGNCQKLPNFPTNSNFWKFSQTPPTNQNFWDFLKFPNSSIIFKFLGSSEIF